MQYVLKFAAPITKCFRRPCEVTCNEFDFKIDLIEMSGTQTLMLYRADRQLFHL